MKSFNLNISELIQFSSGFIGLQGRRLLLHDLSSLGQFRKDLIDTVGVAMAQRILTRKGLFWGQADAAAMQRLFTWDSKAELIKAAPELVKILGLAYTGIYSFEFDAIQQKLLMTITCADSAEVEEYRNELGKSNGSVCWVITGYLSGYVSYCLGTEVYFKETKCQGAEGDDCIFTGKDIASWGNEFCKDQSFFVAEYFHKKVEDLSRRIKEQQRILAVNRRQLLAAKKSDLLLGIEIHSKAFQNVMTFADRVATVDSTLLITGETGSGKEVIARYIHENSPRKKYPFLAVNCSALPEALLENELFGHKAGSFTGARTDEVGLFEAARHGTIFLDEIGDISPMIQVKLLRVLQSKEIRAIGDTRTQTVDIRVISATNRDLDALVADGKFREDLLYRLRVLHIEVPPLRQRTEDILPLARSILDKLGNKIHSRKLHLAPETVDLLCSYSWPGNVRELENALEHAAVLSTDGIITPMVLPSMITAGAIANSTQRQQTSLNDVELSHILVTLEQTNGNRAKAAQLLNISESTLYRRLRELNKRSR